MSTRSLEYDKLRYEYAIDKLWSGGSYGNRSCFARTDRASNLSGFWLAATNEWVCGRLDLHIEADGVPLRHDATSFHPGHQQTTLAGDGLTAEKIAFVPFGAASGAGGSFYMVLRLRSQEDISAPVGVRVICDVRWPAVPAREHTKQPERDHMQRRVRQWLENKGEGEEGDTLWAQTVPFRVDRWDRTLGDAGEVRALRIPEGCEATFSEPGRAKLVYNFDLAAGEEVALPFVLAAGCAGLDALRQVVSSLPRWEDALAGTVSAYDELLNTALLQTPDARINRGLQWAKANTVRVQHDYRLGAAFTNDPPQDIVVVRDCAWYGLGADWLTPGFAASMYAFLLEYGIHEGGKLTEYIHADTGEHEDYALNINDDTPLFVVAVHHHYATTGDAAFARAVYPAVRQACEWILAQRRDGLIWCTVQGADMWGNATWRNIIPGYNLAGAVTEINALCYWALSAAAEMARVISDPGDVARWEQAASELRAAINEKLTTSEGLYVLNVSDADTNPSRTADLVFPLLADVADPDAARRILDLLHGPLFSTPYGFHTVGTGEAEYHRDFGYGLMGGLWPNLTAWVAYAGRKIYPERVAGLMSSVYALSEPENPAAGGHLVPGEFPEWFDGETFESRGMAMSPWMPPTYLWLGVEGLAGVSPTLESLLIAPNIPEKWQWLTMRNLPYRSERLSFFLYLGTLHTTRAVDSPHPQVVYARDASDEVRVEGSQSGRDSSLTVTALENDGSIAILAAATEGFEGTLLFRGKRYEIHLSPGEVVLIDPNREPHSPPPDSISGESAETSRSNEP